ncbi:YbbR-like domain-containing protein [Bacillus sp. FJAT-29790]|uniref:CdaR family protein n=1 Tax=Bacillus sp. FJAT-29790 TaxID=1895002 RepID=UPI001C24E2CE|nr:CdaR family protein [Bacillus sp. FJAT-29790]MBU8880182.1 YbbR-like domain-containing protein [Bacillus sp. FJAT-29790]
MDKWINKLVDTRWFMKIVALILALLFFGSVYNPDKDITNINVPGEQDTEILSDIPVKSYYDTENLVISGVPETVKLSINGPKSHLQPVKTQRNFEVYIDLSGAELGTKRVPIKIRNISDKLKVTIEPAYANVSIQEKVTKEFKVEAEFNKALLEDGYISESPEAKPNKVKITGAKDVIDRISFVKATVDIKGPVRSTVRNEANIRVLDQDMNKLDVVVEPATIAVIIPVKRINKTVPINLIETGSPPNGITINSISLDVKEVKIAGRQEVLDQTDNVRVEVDVSRINGDTVLTLPVIIAEGINEVNPKTVRATISASSTQTDTEQEKGKVENKTLSNLPIHLSGLSNDFEASLNAPSNGKASLTVTGNSDIVQQINAGDFNLFLDLSSLGEGDHEVMIKVNGPDNVNWKLATETASISITPKEAL